MLVKQLTVSKSLHKMSGLNKDCWGIVFEFMARPHLREAIEHHVATNVQLGGHLDEELSTYASKDKEIENRTFHLRFRSSCFPEHLIFPFEFRKIVVIVSRAGQISLPFECTFHKRREFTVGLADDILREYPKMETSVFLEPSLLEVFEERKKNFIETMLYRSNNREV